MTAAHCHVSECDMDGADEFVPEEQSYREQPPVPALRRLVSTVWVQRVGTRASAYPTRSLPNGSVELRCHLGAMPRLAGPVSSATTEVLAPGTTLVGVRFRPGAAGALGVPTPALTDGVVDAREIWADAAERLSERLATALSPKAAVALVQRALCARLDGTGTDALVTEAVHRLMPWHGREIRSLAADLGVSDRQLRRRCGDAVGVTPKVLHRMLRFQGFLALAQQALARGRPPATEGLAVLAAEAGYTDQAHLSHECQRLAGVTPRAFLDETARSCGCGHDHTVSYVPILRRRTDVRSLQEPRHAPA